jgi:AraC family transcriptional regulator
MRKDCPYCSLARKNGELYCSRHSSTAEMQKLNSGIFYIREKKFEECDWHVTRLSLNFNFDGPQIYFVGNREYRISPEKYLLINEGQSFKTSAHSETENRMVTVAFKVGLAEQIYTTLSHDHDYLLDHPFLQHGDFQLFEKTYPMDDYLKRKILFLLQANPDKYPCEQLNDDLEEMLARLLLIQKGVQNDLLSINKVRTSTRKEIYKRLQWALEYINNHYQDNIGVEDLARYACLSSFHFKRLFKAYFSESPYQYIKRLRLEKAGELLLKGLPVNEVCKAVGWEDPSSFIRLFKKTMAVTPNQYKMLQRT